MTASASGLSSKPGVSYVLFGDSNTWIGGDNCDNPRGWNYWFARTHRDDSIRSYARSGATWTATSASRHDIRQNVSVLNDTNIIYNQINRLAYDLCNGRALMPDVILVGGGTNDAWFAGKRPGIFDVSVDRAFDTPADSLDFSSPCRYTSLAGSARMALELLRRTCPGALIVVMTPLQTTAAPMERQLRVSETLSDVADRLGLPVIRMDTVCPVRADSERERHVLTSDGTHTSVEGARMVAETVSLALEPIIKCNNH